MGRIGVCEQDTFQDSKELAWSLRKTAVGRCGAGGQSSVKV